MFERASTSSLVDLTDAELIRRFRRGDDEALEALLSRHRDALYRFCRHLVSNREDAEDICQESLARAVARVDTLESESAFRSWLFRIARNLSIDAFRNRRRTCPLPDEEVIPPPLHVQGPQDQVETGEEYQTVAEALTRLAQSHQKVLMMREVEGLSYADIAERLDVSQSAVETLLFRARRRLREEYGKNAPAIPGVALLAGMQEFIQQLAAPLTSAPPLATKVALSAAMVAAVVAAPRAYPSMSPAPTHQAASHVAAIVHRAAPVHIHRRPPATAAIASPRPPAIRSTGKLYRAREPVPARSAVNWRPSPATAPRIHHVTPVRFAAISLPAPRMAHPLRVPLPRRNVWRRVLRSIRHVVPVRLGVSTKRSHRSASPGTVVAPVQAPRIDGSSAPSTQVAASRGRQFPPRIGVTSRRSVLDRPGELDSPPAVSAQTYPPPADPPARPPAEGARSVVPSTAPAPPSGQPSGVPRTVDVPSPPAPVADPRAVPVSAPAARGSAPSGQTRVVVSAPVAPRTTAPTAPNVSSAPVVTPPARVTPVGNPPLPGAPAGNPPPVAFPPTDRGGRP